MTRPTLGRSRAVAFAALVALSASAGALAAVMVVSGAPDRLPAARELAPSADAPTDAAGEYAQTYSPYCQTAQGVCTLPSALPIGSACDCGGSPGRVIP